MDLKQKRVYELDADTGERVLLYIELINEEEYEDAWSSLFGGD
jgi:hypothetical protein